MSANVADAILSEEFIDTMDMRLKKIIVQTVESEKFVGSFKEKKSVILAILALTFLCPIGAVSTDIKKQSATAVEKSAVKKVSNKKVVLRPKEFSGLTVLYRGCLDMWTRLDWLGENNTYYFMSQENCEKDIQGKWRIQLGTENFGMVQIEDGELKERYSSKVINNTKVHFREREDYKEKERSVWSAQFICNDKIVNIFYYRDPEVTPTPWKHKPPKVFMEFLENTKCEKLKTK